MFQGHTQNTSRDVRAPHLDQTCFLLILTNDGATPQHHQIQIPLPRQLAPPLLQHPPPPPRRANHLRRLRFADHKKSLTMTAAQAPDATQLRSLSASIDRCANARASRLITNFHKNLPTRNPVPSPEPEPTKTALPEPVPLATAQSVPEPSPCPAVRSWRQQEVM